MALPAGPKTKNHKPLYLLEDPVAWFEFVTGKPLYEWQREVLRDLQAGKRPRVAYVQVPRKSGKSYLAAAMVLAEACLKPQRHIYAISDSERNLNSVLIREVRDIVGASEHLRDSILVFKNHIEVPETGSFIETRPNNFRASQGINPHLVCFDEVHLQKSDDCWSGMQMAGAAREDALLFGITTPGYDLNSMAHGMYTSIKAGNEDVYGVIYEPEDPAADIDDREAWRQANPCYDRPGFAEALEYDRKTLPEHEFRRFRMGQWTATAEAWLPAGAWDGCKPISAPEIGPGTRIVLGFDGSFSGDSTALVAATLDTEVPHLFVVGVWENPGSPGWRVPRGEVEVAIAKAFEFYKVQAIYCDPPYWQREISEWGQKFGESRVLEFPTFSVARMAPLCTMFYSGVMERNLTHDGNPALARHLNNCVVKASMHGDVITKQDKDSPAKIDLAVAAVLAYGHAAKAVRRSSPAFVL